MRLPVLFAAAALLSNAVAAHADTITVNLADTNVIATRNNTGNYGANTNFFPQFNPSLGVLNSLTLSLNGTATDASGRRVDLDSVDPATSPGLMLNFSTQGAGNSTFTFSASGQNATPFDFTFFEGTGTQALQLEFSDSTTVNSASGTLTYNYIPTAAAVTPEPSSIVLLGTGLLGIAGVVRKRLT